MFSILKTFKLKALFRRPLLVDSAPSEPVGMDVFLVLDEQGATEAFQVDEGDFLVVEV